MVVVVVEEEESDGGGVVAGREREGFGKKGFED